VPTNQADLAASSRRARWTLEPLADELVRHTEHRSISRETVHRDSSDTRCEAKGIGQDQLAMRSISVGSLPPVPDQFTRFDTGQT